MTTLDNDAAIDKMAGITSRALGNLFMLIDNGESTENVSAVCRAISQDARSLGIMCEGVAGREKLHQAAKLLVGGASGIGETYGVTGRCHPDDAERVINMLKSTVVAARQSIEAHEVH